MITTISISLDQTHLDTRRYQDTGESGQLPEESKIRWDPNGDGLHMLVDEDGALARLGLMAREEKKGEFTYLLDFPDGSLEEISFINRELSSPEIN